MQGFRDRGFVQSDTLEHAFLGGGFIQISGEIACSGRIVLAVNKFMEVLDGEGLDTRVQTFQYAYNASVRGQGNLLRYDNVHAHPGHPNEHHRHDYDWRTGEELHGSPFWVGEPGWPTLSQFMEEVESWYWEHREELPEPDAFVPEGELRTAEDF